MKKKGKTKRIEIRVTEEEFNKVQIKANRSHGGVVSKFVRELLFGSVFNIKKRKK